VFVIVSREDVRTLVDGGAASPLDALALLDPMRESAAP